MKYKIAFIIHIIGIACLLGCTSPLKSDDRLTRLQAVEKIVSQDDLFFIAMNVGLDVGSRHGSFNNSAFYYESYADDVREAATRRLTDPVFLLRCATWQDGDKFCNFMDESGGYVYNGERYYVQGGRLHIIVHPGDNVRNVAIERLCEPTTFAAIVNVLADFYQGQNERRKHSVRAALFSGEARYHIGGEENAFVDCHAMIKQDNPLNRVLAKVVSGQRNQGMLADFLVSSQTTGLDIWPDAMDAAIVAINGSNQHALAKAFDALFQKETNNARSYPAVWGWRLLSKMTAPSEERQLAMAMIGYGGETSPERRHGIDGIAETSLVDCVWTRCYKEELFKGYPLAKMLVNVKSPECMAQLLIDLRRINTNDINVAFAHIKDVAMLERIKRDCYLKVVADKAESLHFALTYQQRLETIGKMNSKIEKAIAANNFQKQMRESDIASENKDEVLSLVGKWIDAGVSQILADADDNLGASFHVAGFRPGMRVADARLLLECRYPEDEISLFADKKDLIERIDLGMTFLAKIYKFNAQTWADWIVAFSQKMGLRFVEDELRDERRPIGGRGAAIKVSQRIWRCQDIQRDVAITYFGDKNIQEVEPEISGFLENAFKIARGVTGGDIVKGVVLEGARHWANKGWEYGMGGAPGTLRVERGTVGPGGTRKIPQTTGSPNLDRTADTVKDTWEAVKDLFN